jgi:hypothetical protein
MDSQSKPKPLPVPCKDLYMKEGAVEVGESKARDILGLSYTLTTQTAIRKGGQ